MDEKTITNNSIQDDINTKKEDTFFIRDYFEGNNTLLIACISAMVAAFSFVISLIAYVFQCISAQAWNIPIDIITVTHGGKFYYYVIASIAYYLFTIISIEFFAKLYTKNNDLIVVILYGKSAINFCRKSIKNKKRTINKLKKSLYNNKKNKSDKKKITAIGQEINEAENVIKETKDAVRKLKKILYCTVIVLCMIIAMILLPIWIFFYIFNGKVTFVAILAWIISIITFERIGYRQAMERIGNKSAEAVKKAIKKSQGITDNESLKFYISNLKSEKNTENSIIKYKKYFSDRNIYSYLLAMAIVTVVISIYTIITGTSNAKHQKEFYVIESDKEIYAVVFQTENLNVLEKIEITGNNAVIDTSFQKYVPYENLSLQKMKFEKVEIK